MKIETFEQIETDNEAETMAHDAASLELIERLGLSGQLAQTDKKTITRNPYRQMREDENFVYRVLCPNAFKPESYSASPIPLRVLQILAWAKDSGLFIKLEIWDAKHASVKNPVLVGYCKNPESSWVEDIYILARWGAELLPIEVLFQDAFKKWHADRLAKLSKMKADVSAALAGHEASVTPYVGTLEEPYLRTGS